MDIHNYNLKLFKASLTTDAVVNFKLPNASVRQLWDAIIYILLNHGNMEFDSFTIDQITINYCSNRKYTNIYKLLSQCYTIRKGSVIFHKYNMHFNGIMYFGDVINVTNDSLFKHFIISKLIIPECYSLAVISDLLSGLMPPYIVTETVKVVVLMMSEKDIIKHARDLSILRSLINYETLVV
jgi:hypothetical protein